MKKLKKYTLMLLSSTIIICLLSTPKKIYAINSVYQFNGYQTELQTASFYDDFTRVSFIENDINITMDIDTKFRYVIVNDIIYDYNDIVLAAKIQSNSIFEKNTNITIIEALSNFKPINNLDEFLAQSDISNLTVDFDNINIISPQGYSDEYYVGTYQKSNMLVSMTSTAISLLIGFWVTSAFGSVVGVASSFVSDYLTGIGASSVTTSAYYKKYQTVLNSSGTTREGRQFGLWDKVEACTIWNVDSKGKKICVYYTFESIRH